MNVVECGHNQTKGVWCTAKHAPVIPLLTTTFTVNGLIIIIDLTLAHATRVVLSPFSLPLPISIQLLLACVLLKGEEEEREREGKGLSDVS